MNKGLKVRSFFLAGALMSVFYFALWLFVSPGTKFYEFFFNRSFVQWLTTGTFCLAIGILVDWLFDGAKERRNLSNLLEGNDSTDDNSLIVRRLEQIQVHLQKYGMKSAFAVEKESESQDEDNLCRRYSIISHLTQVMLALGFFGTIFNLSGEFFQAFSNTAATSEAIKAGISQFTNALSTALDTTILGLVLSMFASTISMIIRAIEETLYQDIHQFIHDRLSLHPAGDEESEAILGEIKREFQVILKAVTTETRTTLEHMVNQILCSHQMKLQEISTELIRQLRSQDVIIAEELAHDLSSRLSAGIERAAAGIEKQNGHVVAALVEELQRMERIFPKTPEEIVFRTLPHENNNIN